ncbi:hypothetical protein NVP1187O_057 [Vibrio phage 1.187.O._10N.286.49.F1]|nr:hypothetical protein NVP1187O_057 [Vibrio phage 1.187.O._10N.286.49.F1]
MKPTREQVIKMLMSDTVYQALDLESFYDEDTGLYPNIYEVLDSIGIGEMEIGSVMQGE